MDLKRFKSMAVIDTPDKVDEVLRARASSDPRTHLTKTRDGQCKIVKSYGIARAAEQIDQTRITHLQERARILGVQWAQGYENRLVPYRTSDESVDSYGSIVNQNWRFNAFERNPAMPLSHQWGGLAAGIWLEWAVVESSPVDNYNGPALHQMGLFPPGDPLTDSVHRQVKAGILRGASVGFVPGQIIRIEDPEERKQLGLPDWGVILDNNTLLETSPVLIGANENALALLSRAATSGLITAEDADVARELARAAVLMGPNPDSVWSKADSDLRAMWGTAFPSLRMRAHKDVREPAIQDERILRNAKLFARQESAPEIRELRDLLQSGLMGMRSEMNAQGDLLELIAQKLGIQIPSGDPKDTSDGNRSAPAILNETQLLLRRAAGLNQ